MNGTTRSNPIPIPNANANAKRRTNWLIFTGHTHANSENRCSAVDQNPSWLRNSLSPANSPPTSSTRTPSTRTPSWRLNSLSPANSPPTPPTRTPSTRTPPSFADGLSAGGSRTKRDGLFLMCGDSMPPLEPMTPPPLLELGGSASVHTSPRDVGSLMDYRDRKNPRKALTALAFFTRT